MAALKFLADLGPHGSSRSSPSAPALQPQPHPTSPSTQEGGRQRSFQATQNLQPGGEAQPSPLPLPAPNSPSPPALPPLPPALWAASPSLATRVSEV